LSKMPMDFLLIHAIISWCTHMMILCVNYHTH
jgi:hypothetical protein